MNGIHNILIISIFPRPVQESPPRSEKQKPLKRHEKVYFWKEERIFRTRQLFISAHCLIGSAMKRYSAEVLLLSCLKFVIQVPLSFYPSWYGQKSLSLYPVTEKESINFGDDCGSFRGLSHHIPCEWVD